MLRCTVSVEGGIWTHQFSYNYVRLKSVQHSVASFGSTLLPIYYHAQPSSPLLPPKLKVRCFSFQCHGYLFSYSDFPIQHLPTPGKDQRSTCSPPHTTLFYTAIDLNPYRRCLCITEQTRGCGSSLLESVARLSHEWERSPRPICHFEPINAPTNPLQALPHSSYLRSLSPVPAQHDEA